MVGGRAISHLPLSTSNKSRKRPFSGTALKNSSPALVEPTKVNSFDLRSSGQKQKYALNCADTLVMTSMFFTPTLIVGTGVALAFYLRHRRRRKTVESLFPASSLFWLEVKAENPPAEEAA
jgi:hypothetical protein